MRGVLSGVCLCLLLAMPAAASDEIAQYRLSLFGYGAGMTLEQAQEVRQFHRMRQYADDNIIGYVDQLLVEEIEFSLLVEFSHNMLYKVVARYQPLMFDELLVHMEQAFGPGKDVSRTVTTANGVDRFQKLVRWNYPGVRLMVAGDLGNTGYATVSLLVNKTELFPETPEQ